MVGRGTAFSVIAFIVSMFATIATAALIMYSASMSLLNVMPNVPIRRINYVTGLIVVVAAVSVDLLTNVIDWLSFQGILLIPLFAIVLTDYFLVRGRHYDVAELFRRDGAYWGTRGFHISGLIAWVIGAIAYEVVHNELPALGGGVVSFAVSVVAYWALAKTVGVRPGPVRTTEAHDDSRTLDPITAERTS
jgi:purine-cytosine permease-like protein